MIWICYSLLLPVGMVIIHRRSLLVKIYNKNGLQIKCHLTWTNDHWDLLFTFINVTPATFTDLAFQLAVPKSMTLKMESSSGNSLAPLNTAPITLKAHLLNPQKVIRQWHLHSIGSSPFEIQSSISGQWGRSRRARGICRIAIYKIKLGLG
jgi:hypothetical protein